MRLTFLLAALICFVLATGVGFELIAADRSPTDQLRLIAAWSAWGGAFFVAAHLSGERP